MANVIRALHIGKQVTQVSVVTAKAASRWVLSRRAVAKALASHKGIAGAAASASLAGVAKDVSRDRISTCYYFETRSVRDNIRKRERWVAANLMPRGFVACTLSGLRRRRCNNRRRRHSTATLWRTSARASLWRSRSCSASWQLWQRTGQRRPRRRRFERRRRQRTRMRRPWRRRGACTPSPCSASTGLRWLPRTTQRRRLPFAFSARCLFFFVSQLTRLVSLQSSTQPPTICIHTRSAMWEPKQPCVLPSRSLHLFLL